MVLKPCSSKAGIFKVGVIQLYVVKDLFWVINIRLQYMWNLL